VAVHLSDNQSFGGLTEVTTGRN